MARKFNAAKPVTSSRPVRRSDLIAPFGVGALMNFRGDESLMTAGLDEWPFAKHDCPADWLVTEERLQERLGVSHFRLPPDYRTPGIGINNPNQRIPFVRFPQWHYCTLRGVMEKLPLFSSRRKCPCMEGLDCATIPEKRRPFLLPSRFIAICPKGHIDDFPFMEWVHREGVWDQSHRLQLRPGRSSAGLSGIQVKCSCGKMRSMSGVFNFDAKTGGALHSINYDCQGRTPWLGDNVSSNCGEYFRVVQRGASNVYFPITVSSIYLPLWGEESSSRVNAILDDPNVWSLLTEGLESNDSVPTSKSTLVARLRYVDPDELQKAAQKKFDSESNTSVTPNRTDDEFRREEYAALRIGRGGNSTDLFVDVQDVAQYGSFLSGFLTKINLIRKLRETRAFVGFSRLLPIENQLDPDLPPISEDTELNWRPAIFVRGEGIFLEFNLEQIDKWAKYAKVQDRIDLLNEGYNRIRSERGLSRTDLTAKFVLLHTFAHCLIRQLSFDCGYGSSAIRERIYCESSENADRMQGILIYTASGDSEGTLGGLVRQGYPEELRVTIERTIHHTSWCSSDPVCIESSGQGSDNANFAACHSCALLPETSCEAGNRFLDRAFIVGTTDDPELGFFSFKP